LVLEDESRTIGRLAVPEPVRQRMLAAPLVLVEASQQARAEHIEAEYVALALAQGRSSQELHTTYRDALERIARRLGGLRQGQIIKLLDHAFGKPYAKSDHMAWILALLKEYYDPMYDYQLQKKAERVVFRGDMQAAHAYLAEGEDKG